MNMPNVETEQKSGWTWADQLSTYRFWGLILFYVFSCILNLGINTYLYSFLTREFNLSYSAIGMYSMFLYVGMPFGIITAWITIRYHSKNLLIGALAVQILGALLLTIPLFPLVLIQICVGAFLLGLGSATIAIAVPAILAGGHGGKEAFLVAFGLMITYEKISSMSVITSFGALLTAFDMSIVLPALSAALGIAALIFILPTKPQYFDEPPSRHLRSLEPVYRDPVMVGFACLIPGFIYYWIYRFHGETNAVAPSSRNLNPAAAFWINFLISFMMPFSMVGLVDSLNQRAEIQRQPRLKSPLAIFLLSLFLMPVTMGMVQAALNRFMETRSETTPPPMLSL